MKDEKEIRGRERVRRWREGEWERDRPRVKEIMRERERSRVKERMRRQMRDKET